MTETCGTTYNHEPHLYDYEGVIFKCVGVKRGEDGGIPAVKEKVDG